LNGIGFIRKELSAETIRTSSSPGNIKFVIIKYLTVLQFTIQCSSVTIEFNDWRLNI
jgi:hypothetical protein